MTAGGGVSRDDLPEHAQGSSGRRRRSGNRRHLARRWFPRQQVPCRSAGYEAG